MHLGHVRTQQAAEVQAVLEGVPLPARKPKLVEYARREDETVARLLEALPDREYRSLDDVGEALAPVQPPRVSEQRLPRAESGKPPGGDAYLDAGAEAGSVRPSAPASNPPQKALQQQTETQKRQQERQRQLG